MLSCGSPAPPPPSSYEPLIRMLVQRGAVGQVVDDNGPVQGAVVVLTLQPKRRHGGIAPPHATTDDRGRWSVTDLEPGHYVVTASAAGRGIAIADLDVASYGQVTARPLTLATCDLAPEVIGTVTGDNGVPLEGALVVASVSEAENDDRWWSFGATADVSGAYRLPTDRMKVLKTAFAPGHVVGWVSDTRPYARVPRLDFRLERAAIVVGRVVDAKGRPQANLLVTMTEMNIQTFDRPMTRTDARGRFTLEVPAGEIGLIARGPHARTPAPTWIERGIGQQGEPVELITSPGHVISGSLTCDGPPAAGLWVSVRSMPDDRVVDNVRCGPDGSFIVEGLPPGEYALVALRTSVRHSITIGTEDVTGVTIPVRRAGDANPVRTVAVEVSPPGAYELRMVGSNWPRWFPLLGLHTGIDGRMGLRLIANGQHTLTATRRDGSFATRDVDSGADPLQTIELEVESTPTLNGVVLDAHGQPQVGSLVELRTSDLGRDLPVQLTDDQGRFHVSGLAQGTYQVRVLDHQGPLAWSGQPSPQRWRPLTVRIGAADAVDERFVVVEEAHSLRGTISDTKGRPRAGVRVSAEHATIGREPPDEMPWPAWFSRTAPVLTDEAGRFVLGGLRAGEHTLHAHDPRDGATTTQPGVLAGSTVSVPLPAMGRFRVHVTGHDDALALRMRASGATSSNTTSVSRQLMTSDGRFEVGRLRPGTYSLQVDAPGGTAQTELEITPGETTELTLALTP